MSAAEVWAAVLGPVGVAVGALLKTWHESRRERSRVKIKEARLVSDDLNELVDQLQEQLRDQGDTIKRLDGQLQSLQSDVRTLQTREIAWISHTSRLSQIIAGVPLPVPPLPPELLQH